MKQVSDMSENIVLLNAKQLQENDIMQFRNDFLNAGECFINGSRENRLGQSIIDLCCR